LKGRVSLTEGKKGKKKNWAKMHIWWGGLRPGADKNPGRKRSPSKAGVA